MKTTEQYRQEFVELLTNWKGDKHTLLNNYDFFVRELCKDFVRLTLTTKGPNGRLAEKYFARLQAMAITPQYGPRFEFSPADRAELLEDLKSAYEFRAKALTPVSDKDRRKERLEYLTEKGNAAVSRFCYGRPDEPWVDHKLALDAYRELMQELRHENDDSLLDLALKIEKEVIPHFRVTS